MGLFCLIILVSATAKGKSLYTIVDTGSSKVWAYEIDANSLTYPTEYDSPYGSAVGLALDGDYMFLTFETGDDVEVASAKTMTSVQLINAPGSSNLAGIAADHSKQKVYVVDRTGTSVYIYDWNPRIPELTLDDEIELQDLQSGEGTWGLALDEDNGKLYVTLNANTVRCYDTNYWSHLSNDDITVTHDAVGIAIDVPNQIIYTGSPYDQSLLSKFDIDANSETTIDVTEIDGNSPSDHILGLAVDQDTGLIYATIGNTGIGGSERVVVFDPNLTLHWSSSDVGDPAGIAVAEVSYKEPLLDIVKDDNDVNCVYPLISEAEHDLLGTPYNWLYYNISYDMDGHADTNVVVTDYLPFEVDFDSCSTGGAYDANEHTVTWELGDLGSSASGSLEIRVGVNYYAKPGGTITNVCEIEGDAYASLYAVVDSNVCAYGSEIIYVDEDANGYNNGTSWDDAYTDLQDGFTGARNCGASVTAIWVAAGTYKPTQLTNDQSISFELVEDVGVFGHFGGVGTYETSTSQRDFDDANNTTILTGTIGDAYGEQVYRVIYGQNIEDAIVDGFTLTGASQDGIYFDDCDGSVVNCKLKDNDRYGIYCYNYSYPDVHNCLFTDNSSGGLYITSYCWPEISYCTFDGNDTTYDGVYIGNSVVVVENSVFEDHTDNGIEGSNGTLTVTNCDFSGDNDNAIQISDITTTVTNCSIKDCGDDGIYANDSDLTIDHTVISGSYDNALYTTGGCNLTLKNSVVRHSGESGLELNGNYATTIKNNWIHDNGTDRSANYGGSGIWFTNQVSVPLIRNNTIYKNYTYGIESSENGADPNVINCIIYGNDSNDFYRENDTFDTVNYCNLQNSHSGTGNITGDPGFKNIGTDPNDLHLDETSQCKNAGDPNGSYGDETDIDGENRIYYGRVDMGADEYYRSPADFDEDGYVNFIDYAMFADFWRMNPTENPNDYNDLYDLRDNNSIDNNDLDRFCDDWLWKKAWDEGWMMAMGRGGGSTLMSSMMMESSFFSLEAPSIAPPADDLMLSATESIASRPERLRAKSQKFYDITPETTISARQKQLDIMKVDIKVNIKEILQWLDKIWLSGELKETMTEEQYLKFRKAIEDFINF